MLKKLFITVAFMANCILMNAQTTAPDYKGTSNNNPISAAVFCADPTALEYKGRLYVYGSNDHQQFIKNGKKNGNGYGDITSLVVFSTDDMVNWTFHGTIDTKKLCSSWTPNAWYKGYGVSWAPSVTWRTTTDGKDEFFLYFCNSSHGVGVLKADSPVGPWKSPLKQLLIHYDTPGANAIGTNANFDPGVVIDENGVGWLSFGGLGPSEIMPNAARIVKLKPSMTEVDGAAVKIPAPYHFEANELNVMDGKFVYTYCSNWANRADADWNVYKQEHNVSMGKPDQCTMCYMVSDNPTDPNSWKYKGVYGKHPGFPSPNNHSHLHKFQGNYYYIYHWGPLMQKMKDGGAIDSSCDGFRSICINKATVNENTQQINSISLNLTGATAIKDMNPYELLQAETMANCGGISYEDFSNIEKNTSISTLGNDASRNMQVRMSAGSWIKQQRLNFGTTGAAKFTLRAKGTGTMEVRVGNRTAQASATIDFASTTMTNHTIDLDVSKFIGAKTIYFVVTKATNAYVDAWQFTEVQTDGIEKAENVENVTQQSYDLMGRSLDGNNQHRGLVIKQYTDKNGVKRSRKTLH